METTNDNDNKINGQFWVSDPYLISWESVQGRRIGAMSTVWGVSRHYNYTSLDRCNFFGMLTKTSKIVIDLCPHPYQNETSPTKWTLEMAWSISKQGQQRQQQQEWAIWNFWAWPKWPCTLYIRIGFDKVIAQAFQFSHELSKTQMVRLSL